MAEGNTSQVDAVEAPGWLADASDLVRRAADRAVEAHRGQYRKGDRSPYVTHPYAVATVLRATGVPDHVLAAALLHDVVEDTDSSVAEIEADFGADVARLVDALSEDKELAPYEHRKLHHRNQIQEAGAEAALIYAADKLTNIRDLRAAYEREGEVVSEHFNAPLDVRIELWEGDLVMLRASGAEIPFLDEFEEELSRLTEDRAREAR